MVTKKKPFTGNANRLNINVYELSKREQDVLNRLVTGDSYKMIAESFSINIGTVNSHIYRLYKKLHVNSKSAVILKAIREKLV